MQDFHLEHISATPEHIDSLSKTELKATIDLLLQRQEHLEQQNQELHQQNRQLKESNSRFEVALQNSSIIIFTQDLDLRYTWIHNPIYDAKDFDLISKTDYDIFPIREEAEQLIHIKKQALRNETSMRRDVCIHIGENAYHFDLTVIPLYIDGMLTGVICTAMDITTHRRIEIAERRQRLLAQSLRNTALALNSTLNLSEVLDHVLENLEYVVAHDRASIALVEEKNPDQAYISRTRDARERMFAPPDFQRFKMSEVFPFNEISANYQPLILNNTRVYQEAFKQLKAPECQSFIGVPLILQNKISGFLFLYSFQPDFFDTEDLQRLQLFALQVTLAIQNALLYQHVRELAMKEERQRLARDLHDAVSQSLFASKILAETLPDVYKQDPDAILEHLEQIRILNQSAQAEMRMLLLELRPKQLLKIKLPAQLEQLASAVLGRKKIQLTLEIAHNKIPIPAHVAITLYRIAQEALNNVVKHSRAQHVKLALENSRTDVKLTVEDNGQGFDVQQLEEHNSGLGLCSMAERAEEIKAIFNLNSQPKQGTTIQVIWRH